MKPRKLLVTGRARISGFRGISATALAVLTAVFSQASKADEGGVSMWLPGLFGSLAAVPQQQPGWSGMTTYYHTSVSAGADVARAREITIGNLPVNVTATVNASLVLLRCYDFPPRLSGHLFDSLPGSTRSSSVRVSQLALPQGRRAFRAGVDCSTGDPICRFACTWT